MNIELLSHAAHLIDSKPDFLFNLDQISDDGHSCGTIGCVMGHCAMDAVFNRLGLSLNSQGALQLESISFSKEVGVGYDLAGSVIFGITEQEAFHLFTSYSSSKYDPKGCEYEVYYDRTQEGFAHKEAFFRRLRMFLDEKKVDRALVLPPRRMEGV